MSASFEDGGEDEQIRSKIDEQVRWYMRERYACRLKLCAVAQLVGSGAYGFGPRLLPSYAFGLLCAAGGALAFGAAHTCRRPLLLSHCAACVAVLLSAAPVVGALRGLVPPDHVAHPKSTVHGRLLLYACLTALHALLQLPALYAGAAILWWPATSAASELGGMLGASRWRSCSTSTLRARRRSSSPAAPTRRTRWAARRRPTVPLERWRSER